MKWPKKVFFQWWQRCKRHPVVTFIIVSLILVILISIGYNFDGTGFGSGNQITTSRIISGPSKGAVTQIDVYQQGKTLWDWLQLLIVPIVLAAGGFVITIATNRGEREIADDNQREATLQSYLDKISELLLEKDLRNSKIEDEKQKIARVRTLTVLSRLNRQRKKSLLQFLYESGLIDKKKPIVSLVEADLSRVNLRGTDLRGADLSEADLSGANLSGANLSGADLSGADLSGANLFEADLFEADLFEAELNEANLSGANLLGVDLRLANLSGANLSGANLSGANLSEADLRGTNLSGAGLSGADLSGADLSGVDLRGAIFTKEQLDKAKNLSNILFTDSSVIP